MKATINPLLEQTSFDSAAPSGAAAVVHKFTDPGEYLVRVIGDEADLAHVRLTVDADPPGKESPPDGISIDWTKIAYSSKMGGTDGHEDPFIVRPKGYVSFTASGRAKSYAVVAEPKTESKTRDTRGGFDSRRLGRDDIFTLTLIRPGEYRVVNELGKYEGLITVAYPVIGDRPYRPPPPHQVDCNESGFQPSTITLQPAQGIIFNIRAAARIKVDLTRPDDGPKDRPPRKVGISPQATRQAVERWRQAQQKKRKS
jgi:hypothetical protein